MASCTCVTRVSGPACGFQSRSSRSTGTTWSASPPRGAESGRSPAADAVARWIATAAGLGYVPRLPGTATSLVAAFAVWAVAPAEPPLVAAAVLVVIAGVWASGREETRVGVHDPGSVVVDEVAGMLIALVGHPRGLGWVLALFLLFRLLDVWKPFPIRQLQGLPGGLGIVIDDVVAGAGANLLGRLARWVGTVWP